MKLQSMLLFMAVISHMRLTTIARMRNARYGIIHETDAVVEHTALFLNFSSILAYTQLKTLLVEVVSQQILSCMTEIRYFFPQEFAHMRRMSIKELYQTHPSTL